MKIEESRRPQVASKRHKVQVIAAAVIIASTMRLKTEALPCKLEQASQQPRRNRSRSKRWQLPRVFENRCEFRLLNTPSVRKTRLHALGVNDETHVVAPED